MASAEQVVTAYIAAARSQDRSAIERLTPESFDVAIAVEEKLARYRELRDRPLVTHYLQGLTPSAIPVRIEGEGFSDQIVIERIGTRWYLAIGQARDQPSGVPAGTR